MRINDRDLRLIMMSHPKIPLFGNGRDIIPWFLPCGKTKIGKIVIKLNVLQGASNYISCGV